MEIKLNLTNEEHKDLVTYCNLNDLLISSVVKDSFTTGFNIERYGLLNSGDNVVEKEVVKEIVKRVEIPVEVIKEVVKIEYVEVPVEKIVEVTKEIPVEKVVIKEVIKEVPIEKIVTKIEYISDNTQVNELLSKIQQLENTPQKVIEVIKEIPVEKVVIQEKVVEMIKEVPVEVVKEVVTEKLVGGDLQPKLDALQNTVQKLKQDNIEKDKKIKGYEKTIQEIQIMKDKQAVYLKGSNLDNKLYK